MIFKLLLLLVFTLNLFGDNVFMGDNNSDGALNILKKNAERIEDSQEKNEKSKTEHLLYETYKKIELKQIEIDEVYKKIKITKSKKDVDFLKQSLEKKKKELIKLDDSLTQISLGSINVKELENQESEKINLERSLEDIFEPFAIMLMRFTEVPRKIEYLNLEIEQTTLKIEKLKIAIKTLRSYKVLSPNLQAKIDSLSKEYAQKRLILMHRVSSLTAQLEKLQINNSNPINETKNAFIKITKTHGLTVLYTFISFVIVFTIMKLLRLLINTLYDAKLKTSSMIFSQRLFNLLLSIATVIIAVTIAIFIIYSRADWLILAIVLFILFTVILSLKNLLPKYISEMNLMLNIGIVRENERLIYKGVPFIVEKIGIHAIINNSALANAKVRLSLDELETMTSRELSIGEALFPTSVDDYIFVDNSYGRVKFQSPEIVTVHTFGKAVKTYVTADFLRMKPINISQNGFSIAIEISIDYKHQKHITDSIRLVLEKALNRSIQNEKFAPYMQKTWVEFNEAKIDSLDFKIISTYEGSAAGDYYHIKRTLRRTVVDTCNANGWRMPYRKLEITQAT